MQNFNDKIRIINASENNLKNVSLDVPKNKFIVITGVSGSGKSSLAFDVLYSEGRRRYVDSLSNYAKQFLGGTRKPDVEAIEGLSPSIAIDQKTTHNNPRSTVGTVTEIYDFYRLLFSRIGRPFCPRHNIEISAVPIKEVVDEILLENMGENITILSPIVVQQKGSFEEKINNLKRQGFVRLQVDGEIRRIDEEIKLKKTKKHNISIVVDRISVSDKERGRIYEAIEHGTEYSDGVLQVVNEKSKIESTFSLNLTCPHGDFSIPNLEPRLFSFNSPSGACFECKGLGVLEQASWKKIINEEKSILDGGIKFLTKTNRIELSKMVSLAEFYKIDLLKPIKKLSKFEREIIFRGSLEPIQFEIPIKNTTLKVYDYIEGIGTRLERLYKETSSEGVRQFYHHFLSHQKCHACEGRRLNEVGLSVRVNDINIHQLTIMSVNDALAWIRKLKMTEEEEKISLLILSEIESRLTFLTNVGLGYLTLDRVSKTLSGGESQRIRLSSQLGSKLSGILYVLDEPSIGLHQSDNSRLIDTLKSIRDLGNTILVVEHDDETMRAADHIIDMGPRAGDYGGEVVAQGTPSEIKESIDSLTAQYLRGEKYIEVPKKRRRGNGKTLQVIGAEENNLKNIDVTIPLGVLTVISGVSGSGKSTLINDIIYIDLYNKLTKSEHVLEPGKHVKINGMEHIDKVIKITQDPIGKTPRSNPATYTGVFDPIRDLFASTNEAKLRGYTKGRFSFNVNGGRCDKCNGDGVSKIPMHFLPDVYVECSLCKGKRYNEETLHIKWKGKNIADVLKMSVDSAVVFFAKIPKIYNKLIYLKDVGLGYITLGHSSSTLSGGESQRVKLATHLQKKPTGKTLYLLDEPTTGLHHHDVKKLIEVLNRIVDSGETMVIIEHNLDIIKLADYVIDLGPGGGIDGGKIVAKGPPEVIARSKTSKTGPYLRDALNK